MLRYFALGACAFLLVACATITKGTTQVVAIDTPGVPSATCTITTQSGPQVVTTPGTVTLKKGSDPLPIACVKDCYVNGQSIIPSGAAPVVIADHVADCSQAAGLGALTYSGEIVGSAQAGHDRTGLRQPVPARQVLPWH